RLNAAFDERFIDFIQQEGDHDRHDESRDDLHGGDIERIPDDALDVRHMHDILEVPPSDPLGTEQSVDRLEILKGDSDSYHGDVTEDEDENNAGQQHEMKRRLADSSLKTHGFTPPMPPE